ncbi:MAG: tetratricopeptide repeat protein [bacterium]|nr:tetratricopeptide repeat protein [bacterium]
MDFIEKGKSLAQQGDFENALDAFLLALENDKENPDIHFYLGLSYSSLEKFEYAKHHYEIALRLDPNHQKTRLVWDGVKNVDSKRPPERKMILKAIAKERQEQQEQAPKPGGYDDTPIKSYSLSEGGYDQEIEPDDDDGEATIGGGRYKVSEDKWEKAFPAEELARPSGGSGAGRIVLILIVLAALGAIGYFLAQQYPEYLPW